MADGSDQRWLDERVSLREYLERLVCEHERRQVEQMAALDRALQLARDEDERRFTLLNELRREVMTDRAQFLSREVHDSKESETVRWREEITKDFRLLGNRVTAMETRVSTWAAVLAALIVVFQVASRWMFK